MNLLNIILVCLSLIFVQTVTAAPLVGKKAAAKYFQAKGNDDYEARYPSSIESLTAEDHYMALGVSNYANSKAYKWGQSGQEDDVGKTGIDMTYRMTQTYELFDEVIRVSYNTYKPAGQKASKMSFMYGLTLPDATSKFPLYFGAAIGPGVFFNQLSGETTLSFDYHMFFGLRLFNLFESTGFFIEGGLKNHLHLTSDGQLNGTYVSAGAIFTF